MYTVQKLAQLAGVSGRTLRYYDEIELLKPARINSSGYRIYGQKEVDRLQQILFYRKLDIDLDTIKSILSSSTFDELAALIEHKEKLLEKRERLERLITTVENTLAYKEGRIDMNDTEKFQAFKEKMIGDNEKKFGEEVREKYRNDQLSKSNKMLKNMTQDQYQELEKLNSDVIDTLILAFDTKDPASELAQKAAGLHGQWLCYFWDSYSKEAHMNIAQMYLDDERFKAYYDNHKSGLAEFLRDAIAIYTQ